MASRITVGAVQVGDHIFWDDKVGNRIEVREVLKGDNWVQFTSASGADVVTGRGGYVQRLKHADSDLVMAKEIQVGDLVEIEGEEFVVREAIQSFQTMRWKEKGSLGVWHIPRSSLVERVKQGTVQLVLFEEVGYGESFG